MHLWACRLNTHLLKDCLSRSGVDNECLRGSNKICFRKNRETLGSISQRQFWCRGYESLHQACKGGGQGLVHFRYHFSPISTFQKLRHRLRKDVLDRCTRWSHWEHQWWERWLGFALSVAEGESIHVLNVDFINQSTRYIISFSHFEFLLPIYMPMYWSFATMQEFLTCFRPSSFSYLISCYSIKNHESCPCPRVWLGGVKINWR